MQIQPSFPSYPSSPSDPVALSSSPPAAPQAKRYSFLPSKFRKKVDDQNLPLKTSQKPSPANTDPEKYSKSFTQWISYFQEVLSTQTTPKETVATLTAERARLIAKGCKTDSLYLKTIDTIIDVYERSLSLHRVNKDELLKIISDYSPEVQLKSKVSVNKVSVNLEALVKDLLRAKKLQRGLSGKQIVRLATDYCLNFREIKVNLDGCDDIEDEDLELLSHACDELITIKIDGNGRQQKITDAGINSLTANSPKLRSFNLHNCSHITDNTIASLAEHCPNVVKITLSKVDRITDLSLLILALKLPKLRSIKIFDCPKIGSQGVKALLSNLSNLRKVTINGKFELSTEFLIGVAKQLKESLTKFKIQCYLDRNYPFAVKHFMNASNLDKLFIFKIPNPNPTHKLSTLEHLNLDDEMDQKPANKCTVGLRRSKSLSQLNQ